jgi:hypothetical protein
MFSTAYHARQILIKETFARYCSSKIEEQRYIICVEIREQPVAELMAWNAAFQYALLSLYMPDYIRIHL